MTKIGESKGRSRNGDQKMRIEEKATGTKGRRSVNVHQKRRTKGEPVDTKEKGSGNGDEKMRIKRDARRWVWERSPKEADKREGHKYPRELVRQR